MTKHTPGPWKVVLTGAAQQASIAVVGNGKLIYEFPMSFIDEQPEHQANAQLISAAPKMLAALESVVNDIGMMGLSVECLQEVGAAIDKAEGSA